MPVSQLVVCLLHTSLDVELWNLSGWILHQKPLQQLVGPLWDQCF